MRGPKPKPAAVHLLHGTHRPDRHAGDELIATGAPGMPDHLDAEAAAEWDRVTVHLADLGTLAESDRALIALHCVLCSRLRDAETKINELGQVIKSTSGNAQVNPYCGLALRIAKELRAVDSELGLSPTSRTRLRIERPRKPGKFDEFLASAPSYDPTGGGNGRFFTPAVARRKRG